jgi:hypothetical protein
MVTYSGFSSGIARPYSHDNMALFTGIINDIMASGVYESGRMVIGIRPTIQRGGCLNFGI